MLQLPSAIIAVIIGFVIVITTALIITYIFLPVMRNADAPDVLAPW